MTIKNEKFIRTVSGTSLVLAELAVSTSAELPAADGISGLQLAEGSIAWDISTGDLYGLKSDGIWVNQTDATEFDPSAEEETSQGE